MSRRRTHLRVLMGAAILTTALAIFAGLHRGTGSGIGAAAERSEAQDPLPTVTLDIDGHSLVAEVARTREQRYMGLSFRQELGDAAGMLFVYPDTKRRAYTMRNTLIPLSIAFIDENRVIDEIIDMDVGPGQIFPSREPAMYALEVNQGWFDRRDIEPGSLIRVPDDDDLTRLDGAED